MGYKGLKSSCLGKNVGVMSEVLKLLVEHGTYCVIEYFNLFFFSRTTIHGGKIC